MTALCRAVTLFLVLKLTSLVVNVVRFPVLHQRAVHDAEPGTVSLLVPMRNEASMLHRSLPPLLQQDVLELIILDDQSTDGSAQLAQSLMTSYPHARVVAGAPAPPGWVGKSWACHQLSELAAGSLLVFCDADVLLAAGAVEAAKAEMTAQHAAVFSVFPRQITGTWGERLIIPLIDDVLLCFLPFGLLSLDVPAAATANGSLFAFTRSAYTQLQGFAAVREHLGVEDVMMARRTRRAGLKLGLALGGRLVETRMYTGYAEVIAGMGRGLLPVTGGSRSRLMAAAAWHMLAYFLPLLLAPTHRRWAIPLTLGILERALVDVKTQRRVGWPILLAPLSPVAALPLFAQALRAHQQWKGRSYS